MIIALGLRTPVAVATSLVLIVVNSAAGLVPYLIRADAGAGFDWPVVATFALAAIVVTLPAGRLARRIPAARLRRGFAVLVLLVAAGVTTQALVAPDRLDPPPTTPPPHPQERNNHGHRP